MKRVLASNPTDKISNRTIGLIIVSGWTTDGKIIKFSIPFQIQIGITLFQIKNNQFKKNNNHNDYNNNEYCQFEIE